MFQHYATMPCRPMSSYALTSVLLRVARMAETMQKTAMERQRPTSGTWSQPAWPRRGASNI